MPCFITSAAQPTYAISLKVSTSVLLLRCPFELLTKVCSFTTLFLKAALSKELSGVHMQFWMETITFLVGGVGELPLLLIL